MIDYNLYLWFSVSIIILNINQFSALIKTIKETNKVGEGADEGGGAEAP